MFSEHNRLIRVLPRYFRIVKQRQNIGLSRFTSTALSEKRDDQVQSDFENFRFRYTEFLPCPDIEKRNPVREKLERREMLRRRNVIAIPEFYVGSIVAVTTSDKHAVGKTNRFLGICIQRLFNGLGSTFILRNVVEHQGVEIQYYLYSPLIRTIEVMRLEKRLDDELFYLRDAPLEYSTFPFDMIPQYQPDKNKVPINTIKVPINPRPWLQRYERMDLKGAILPELPQKFYDRAKKVAKPWEKYDLMDEYRKCIPEEEQDVIFKEVCDELTALEKKQKIEKRKKVFVKPTKKSLF